MLQHPVHRLVAAAGLVKASKSLAAFLHPFLDAVPGGFLGFALLLFFLELLEMDCW